MVKDEVASVVELRDSNLLDHEAALYEIQSIGKKYGRFASLTEEKVKEIVNAPPPAETLGMEALLNGEKAE